MTPWSARWKLTVWNAVILTALFAALCGMMLSLVRGHLQVQADQWMMEELTELGKDVDLSSDVASLQVQLEKLYAVHSQLRFRVLSPSGKTLFASPSPDDVTFPIPSEAALRGGPGFQDLALPGRGRFRVLSMLTQDTETNRYFLQLMAPPAGAGKEFQWYLGTVIATVPVALAVLFVTGYWLARRALAPVDEIAAMAERISADRLDERLPVANPRDELGRLSATLNAMFVRLQHSLEQMRRFTSDAAHELRSPLAALRTKAEVILRSPRDAETYRQVVQHAAEEASRLTELVNQLLILSRHDAKPISTSEEQVRVDRLVRDVIDDFRERAVEQGVSIETSELPWWLVAGDEVLLRQLFHNLIDNALKFTLSNGSIRIWGHIARTDLIVGVQDTGIGISDADQPRIFQRFFRVDPSQNGQRGGAGLGLAICQAIAEMHNGRIEVASTMGEGSCFQVTLPGRVDRRPNPDVAAVKDETQAG